MAAARHNRPFIMIYGGTIKKGFSKLLGKETNISTVRSLPPKISQIYTYTSSVTKPQVHWLTTVSMQPNDQESQAEHLVMSWKIFSNTHVPEQVLAVECTLQTPCPPPSKQWACHFQDHLRIQQSLLPRWGNVSRLPSISRYVWSRTLHQANFWQRNPLRMRWSWQWHLGEFCYFTYDLLD